MYAHAANNFYLVTTSECVDFAVSIIVKMVCDLEEHWFMDVSATFLHVDPWKRRLWATSSVAARWRERSLTLTSPPGPSAT